MESDPFLRYSWKRKVEEEKGQTQEDKDIGLYFRFQEDVLNHPELVPIFQELESAIGTYADSVVRYSAAKKGTDLDAIKSTDNNRRLVHNSLIDVVNHLSREYKALGIDNNWRSAIIGESWEELGDWALTVARKVLNHE